MGDAARWRPTPGEWRGACALRGALGALLLETILAVSVFAMAGLAILGLVSGSVDSLTRSREAVKAADLARSTMAKLEAGIGNLRTLSGPVPRWEDDESAREGDDQGEFSAGFADAPARPSLWEVEIETEPSEFAGLTKVMVRAFRRVSAESDEVVAEYTLHQLVRLSARDEDRAGEEDAISEAARRGAERARRFGPSSPTGQRPIPPGTGQRPPSPGGVP